MRTHSRAVQVSMSRTAATQAAAEVAPSAIHRFEWSMAPMMLMTRCCPADQVRPASTSRARRSVIEDSLVVFMAFLPFFATVVVALHATEPRKGV